MRFKRIIAGAIAVLSIGMCFTACGSSKSSEEETTIPEITIAPISIEPPAIENFTIEPISVELTTTKKVTTQKPTEAHKISFTRGTVSGNAYSSGVTNLKCTVPSGWTYKTDEELADIIGIVRSSKNLEAEFKTYFDSHEVVLDAMAIKDGNTGVIAFYYYSFEKKGYDQSNAPDSKRVAEFAKSEYESNSKFSNISDTKSFKIGNDEYYYFSAMMTENGASAYATNAYKNCGDYAIGIEYSSQVNDFENIIPYFTTKSGSPQSSNAIRMNGGMLEVDSSLFGMSKSAVEAKLGASLGAPEDFPWWDVHQTLYYFDNNGYTFILLFNDNDELDVIYVDEDKEFDNAIFDRYKAKYGEPELINDEYVFGIDNGLHCNVSMEEYTDTGKKYFRHLYMNDNYYH